MEQEQDKARLQRLIQAIADDIKKCSNDMDHYMKLKFLGQYPLILVLFRCSDIYSNSL